MQEAAEKKLEKQAEKKEKELERLTNRFHAQIEKSQQKLKDVQEEKKLAQAEKTLAEDVAKCKVLLQNIQRDYTAVSQVIRSLRKVDETIANDMQETLNANLNALVERSKLVSTEKVS